MSNSVAAKRYALALFELAKEQDQLQLVEEELRIVKSVFQDNKELLPFLQSPKQTIGAKKQLLETAFVGTSKHVVNTMLLLVERHREAEITEVADAYIELANEERGIADAVVTTIRPLTEAEAAQISEQFAKKVGKTSLRIENIVDPSLLGGVKIRIGNRVFDGSLRGKLDRLENQLKAAQ
ncbi:F0F1 ATP synthase subunit delta [Bacillus thermotolerans]|uniref:ATP synthase subunit delta n=1 Tax=Bacillus thermotolerans TaxID=1221996 RepID=A0A0F5HU47_BACTR|nr:F0F1 ATP synthase subunit delta [Bacillus thermotolerans]KKB36530.1 ATP synthase delta chain [Bacillus thermotolerans]KKB41003.1 ATP synthase delta chain [Bacillus thermotolerans]KKB44932.1 ATP synthase delta chain [Bacillus thermotolerans]